MPDDGADLVRQIREQGLILRAEWDGLRSCPSVPLAFDREPARWRPVWKDDDVVKPKYLKPRIPKVKTDVDQGFMPIFSSPQATISDRISALNEMPMRFIFSAPHGIEVALYDADCEAMIKEHISTTKYVRLLLERVEQAASIEARERLKSLMAAARRGAKKDGTKILIYPTYPEKFMGLIT